eukprot:3275376-Pyramimonas_sp.AAC.1
MLRDDANTNSHETRTVTRLCGGPRDATPCVRLPHGDPSGLRAYYCTGRFTESHPRHTRSV